MPSRFCYPKTTRGIPVLILATSAAPPDVQRSYSLHASAHVS